MSRCRIAQAPSQKRPMRGPHNGNGITFEDKCEIFNEDLLNGSPRTEPPADAGCRRIFSKTTTAVWTSGVNCCLFERFDWRTKKTVRLLGTGLWLFWIVNAMFVIRHSTIVLTVGLYGGVMSRICVIKRILLKNIIFVWILLREPFGEFTAW